MTDPASSPQTLRLFPEKLFYKIGEVSRIVGIETYVLRYWETEFPFLTPRKSKAGQRVYTKKDIDLVLQIRRLLYEGRFTIDGVRKKLGGQADGSDEPAETPRSVVNADTVAILAMVKRRLKSLLKQLS